MKRLGGAALSETALARIRAEEEQKYRDEVRAKLREAEPATPVEPPPPAPVATKAPPSKQDNAVGCVSFIVLALILGGVFYACSRSGPTTPAASTEDRSLAAQSPYYIREVCLDSVRDKLKAPSTAKFYDDQLPAWTGEAWGWASYVDAQNSFGAMIRTNFACAVQGTTKDDARVATVLGE